MVKIGVGKITNTKGEGEKRHMCSSGPDISRWEDRGQGWKRVGLSNKKRRGLGGGSYAFDAWLTSSIRQRTCLHQTADSPPNDPCPAAHSAAANRKNWVYDQSMYLFAVFIEGPSEPNDVVCWTLRPLFVYQCLVFLSMYLQYPSNVLSRVWLLPIRRRPCRCWCSPWQTSPGSESSGQQRSESKRYLTLIKNDYSKTEFIRALDCEISYMLIAIWSGNASIRVSVLSIQWMENWHFRETKC